MNASLNTTLPNTTLRNAASRKSAANPTFHLYWLRETGCDAGTPVTVADLPPSIQARVLELASEEVAAALATFHLRLPFLDRKDERQQDRLLSELPLERNGSLIRAVLDPIAATRDMAATCALTDPLWRGAPPERDPAYFATWQRVSVGLQRWIRDQVAEEFFKDPARLEDRANAYPIIVYQSCRPFFGRPRTEFTYDLRDFPWCEDTLASSWKLTGRSLQRTLEGIEARLNEWGNPRLARRYSPVWFEDVLVAVKRKPKAYADLLARESAVINAVIDLGTQPNIENVNRAAKTLNQQLRKIHGPKTAMDLRKLGCGIFEETTRILAKHASGDFQDFEDAWLLEDAGVNSPWSPHGGVRG